jgi:hypothetical protein
VYGSLLAAIALVRVDEDGGRETRRIKQGGGKRSVRYPKIPY